MVASDVGYCNHYFDMSPPPSQVGSAFGAKCRKCGVAGTIVMGPRLTFTFTPSAPCETERPKTWRERPSMLR